MPLAHQQRARWNSAQIEEGVGLITRTLGTTPVACSATDAAGNQSTGTFNVIVTGVGGTGVVTIGAILGSLIRWF